MKRIAPGLLAALLAGCNATLVYRSGSTPPPASQSGGLSVQAHLPGNTVVGAMLITILLADGVRQYLRRPDGSTIALPSAPGEGIERSVNVQDCTLPVEPRAGNLMCR